ncbi:hypothetical protein MIZ03_3391 [Rhodoferax lithotrophicus]|uniref:Uncharacterized protein n=1 Tax=Rhodoferax lithotrophicus TaxID=2798804 RepID=A0ABN6D931_9BURK|nr:hypothetical protein MIZ03_3391 [Rhodoferax sp. MIZ03]
MPRKNCLLGLYPDDAAGEHEPLQFVLSDEEAFGLSKFCRQVASPLEVGKLPLGEVKHQLVRDTAVSVISNRCREGERQTSHLLASRAVLELLLAMARDPKAAMFTACRLWVLRHHVELAGCSGIHLIVDFWPASSA